MVSKFPSFTFNAAEIRSLLEYFSMLKNNVVDSATAIMMKTNIILGAKPSEPLSTVKLKNQVLLINFVDLEVKIIKNKMFSETNTPRKLLVIYP